MKLAYTHRDRLACAVNWGGGVHITFTPEWHAIPAWGAYPFVFRILGSALQADQCMSSLSVVQAARLQGRCRRAACTTGEFDRKFTILLDFS